MISIRLYLPLPNNPDTYPTWVVRCVGILLLGDDDEEQGDGNVSK